MNVPYWIKPTAWGAIGGAVTAIIIGFTWGGWVTIGTADAMETASAKAAVVQAFTPLCIVKAEQEPDKLLTLKEESAWKYEGFVTDAGWVDNVSKNYRAKVARACAETLVEGMSTG